MTKKLFRYFPENLPVPLKFVPELEVTIADRLRIAKVKFLMIFAPFWDEFVNLDDISKLHDKAKIKVI